MPRIHKKYKKEFLPQKTISSLIIFFAIIIVLGGMMLIRSTSLEEMLLIIFGSASILVLGVFITVIVVGQYRRAHYRAISISGIDRMDGISFERYVGELLRFQGYHVQFTKTSSDLGVDIIATKKAIKTAVQVKRRKNLVGRAAISDAVAGMNYYKCSRSMVITNSFFSREAKAIARSNNCILVDRKILMTWIFEFQKRS